MGSVEECSKLWQNAGGPFKSSWLACWLQLCWNEERTNCHQAYERRDVAPEYAKRSRTGNCDFHLSQPWHFPSATSTLGRISSLLLTNAGLMNISCLSQIYCLLAGPPKHFWLLAKGIEICIYLFIYVKIQARNFPRDCSSQTKFLPLLLMAQPWQVAQ